MRNTKASGTIRPIKSSLHGPWVVAAVPHGKGHCCQQLVAESVMRLQAGGPHPGQAPCPGSASWQGAGWGAGWGAGCSAGGAEAEMLSGVS